MQQNRDGAHNISKAFETGDTSLIHKSVAENFVDHREYGDVNGMDSLKALVLSAHAHVKNLKAEVIREPADNEYVLSWKKFTGTGDGQGNTIQGYFNVTGVQITKLKMEKLQSIGKLWICAMCLK